MKLKMKRVVYETVNLEPAEVMGMAEAADLLGITIQGVGAAINRGQLTEIIDPDAIGQRGRRFALRAEVEELATRKARAAEKWEGVESKGSGG